MQPEQNSLVTYAVAAVVILVVMAVRWRRLSRDLPLKLERLWILPTVYLGVVAVTFSQHPPAGWGWVFCLVALVLGAALGWQRGRMMRIGIDPATHALTQTSSPAALLFIVAVVLLRQGARAGAGWLHLDALAMTDMLLALALGLFAAQRLEMFLRGRRLLASAGAIPR